MRVIIGCEFSGTVREAFSSRGHDAWSCDTDPTIAPGQHYQEDIFSVLERTKGTWDLAIFHPPCTLLCNSGVRWLYKKGVKTNGRDETRWENMRKGGEFFQKLRDSGIPRIALENPVPHQYALEYMGPYSQIIQPWQFGHTENKKTDLWLFGLPLLQETDNVKHLMKNMPKRETDKTHYMSPGEDRGKRRSVFFQGIGEAMADQWGNLY
jgi:hypothetical protein